MSLLNKKPPRTGKAYWRSPDELAGTPEFEKFLQREFPQGAPELHNPMTRRRFMTLMGASMALAGLAGCRRPVEKIVPYVKAPENSIPGLPKYYATAMPTGSGGHGLLVESHEGRPTKIEGNALHPSSRGAANVFQQAEILNLYDPDRSKSVTQNGEPKAWADFVAFWQELYPTFLDTEGAGLAVLSHSFSSPSLASLKSEFHVRFPQAHWATYDPVSDETLYEGIRIATGQAYQPVYHFDKAEVVLALDCDFLSTESEDVANAWGFAQARRVASERDAMNRLYVIESAVTLTGGMADHRLPLQRRLIGTFTAALASELRNQGVDIAGASHLGPYGEPAFDPAWLHEVALDLKKSKGRSLVVAGRGQSPTVHALVFAINVALGNVGATVSYYPMRDKTVSNQREFAGLIRDLQAGKGTTLCILSGNAVYDAPVDFDFASAMGQANHTVHLGLAANETAAQCEWHIPQTHFLENWGDVRAVDGAMSVIQPLIAPLFDGHSDIELLSLINSGRETTGYEIIRETWRVAAGLDVGEKKWRRILHDGLLNESALSPVSPSINSFSLGRHLSRSSIPTGAADKDNLEVSFVASASVYDGRYANNGWLQELPDPVTKIVWDNAALISARFAKEAGLRNGEMVKLAYKGHSLHMPVWIVPGQADYSVTLELGYGREKAGRVGEKVGFNTYKLRTSHAPYFDLGLKMSKTGKKYKIANTQDHSSMEGRAIVREATLGHYRKEPSFAPEMVEAPHHESMWTDHKYDTGYQWGMSIDLNVCTGCNACTVACQSENNIPIVGKAQVGRGREMHWIRLDRYFKGDDLSNPQMVYQPVACQHCEMAPCEEVCPVSATVHDKEGLSVMTYNRCIGTRYCSNNCPFKVRRFNFFNYTKDTPETVKMAMNPDVTVRFRGVMEKCTYCVQRINQSKAKAKKENRALADGELRTACQQTCPTDAIVFGNINDPNSAVAGMKAQNRSYDMLAELNLRTRTTYLAKLRNPNPELEKTESPADG
ncbi:MAG: TAT-variant-translocated molybdopterin oxidoreductase [bacterium]